MPFPTPAGLHRAYNGRHRPASLETSTRARTASMAVPAVAATALALVAAGAAVATADQQHPAAAARTSLTASVSAGLAEATPTTSSSQIHSTAGARQAQIEDSRLAARASRSAARAAAAAAAAKAAQRWLRPVSNYRLSSGFGVRWGRLHAGEDFACKVGTKLVSMSTGTVVFAGARSGYGNKVEIKYWDGTVSYFGHMSKISVKKGQKLRPGQLVGLSGNTGRSTGPHLHLEIHPQGGKPVDPLPWLKAHGIKY